ncbi:hypothetical protein Tco_1578543 [Tanacetum coccineum]
MWSATKRHKEANIFAMEFRSPITQEQQERRKGLKKVSVPEETTTSKALVSCDALLDMTGVIRQSRPNYVLWLTQLQVLTRDEFVNEHVVENSKAMSSKEEPKVVQKNEMNAGIQY